MLSVLFRLGMAAAALSICLHATAKLDRDMPGVVLCGQLARLTSLGEVAERHAAWADQVLAEPVSKRIIWDHVVERI